VTVKVVEDRSPVESTLMALETPMPAERATAPLSQTEILGRLNPSQAEAVQHLSGPLLILAGAGSGKTRVLAHRVAYLIASGVKAWQIVAVTFTNKAANEMRDRIAGLIGADQAKEATIGTFHAICARILRRDGDRIGLERSFNIYDRADQLALVKSVLRQLDLDDKRFPPGAMLAFIGKAKDELAEPEVAARQAVNFYEETAARVYAAYEKALADDNAVDFDDLLMKAVYLFERNPEVLARYQTRWQQILVDEYQDTNRAQYQLARLLAAKHRNLAVVGDDDQSIYSWRGADLRNILDFERDYPDARVVKLEQNYRSTQTILDAAHSVVSRNTGRKDKRLWTDKGEGTQIVLFDAYNEYEEAEYVARQVEKLVGGGRSGLLTRRADDEDGSLRYGEIAVMYRINAQSRVLEEAFMRFGIPYQLVGGTRFYERREVKDVLAYVRLARNPADRVALERVINVPARGIGEKTVEELRRWSANRGVSLWDAVGAADANPNLTPRARAQLAAFAELMRGLGVVAANHPPSAVFDAVAERSGLRASIDDKTVEGEERWTNVLELRNHAAEFDEIAPPEGLARFLEEVALVADVDTMEDRPDRVTLITLHAAKGLEFPVVFIVGIEEGLLPHKRAFEDERELEEERRLAYVGMTRAKDRLYLVHAHHRSTWGVGAPSEASRFLSELPPKLVALARGDSGGPWHGVRESASAYLNGWGSWQSGGRPKDALRPSRLPDLSAPANGASGEAGARQATLTTSATWRTGDRVRHPRFGEGIVVSSQLVRGDEEVTVAFVGEGVKRLIAAYAGLEPA
jgi:DNA helicase-2/ATP-dependent DNA helicase PcrA